MAGKPKARKPKGLAVAKSPLAVQPASVAQTRPVFSFEYADRTYDGAWGFHQAADSSHDVLGMLCDLGRRTWGEIWQDRQDGRQKHHSMAISALCADAQRRISELKLDETFGDEVYRFRFSNTARLWGFLLDVRQREMAPPPIGGGAETFLTLR